MKTPQYLLKKNRAELEIWCDARAFGLAAVCHCKQGADFIDGPVSRYEDYRGELARTKGLYMMVVLDHKGGCRARVVVGELSEPEQEEWIARQVGRLDISCGMLVVDNVIVKVPVGKYGVQALHYLPGETVIHAIDHSPQWNKTWVIDQTDLHRHGHREALGPYFRRTRPDRELPDWLKLMILEDGLEDPGREDFWHQFRAAKLDETISESGRGQFIDLVIHLQQVDEFSGDVSSAVWKVRQPEFCPLGVPRMFTRSSRNPGG